MTQYTRRQMDYVISPSGQFNRSGGSIRKTMKKPAFYHWIDQEQAARKQHVEIARITGIGTGRMLDIGAETAPIWDIFNSRAGSVWDRNR